MSLRYQNKNKRCKSDGYYRIGEDVAYKMEGKDIYVKAKIIEINRKIQNCRTQNDFEYLLNIDIYNLTYWVKGHRIRKLKKGENLYYNFGKFEIGQKVYIIDGGYACHIESTVISKRLNRFDSVEYFLKNKVGELYVSESLLAINKREPIDSKFKVGDMISIDYIWRQSTIKYVVKKIFSYENVGIIYYDLQSERGFNHIIEESIHMTKYKEPVRIFSEVDPFGEEDWSDN